MLRCMMFSNPEFRRNIWLEVNMKRFISIFDASEK